MGKGEQNRGEKKGSEESKWRVEDGRGEKERKEDRTLGKHVLSFNESCTSVFLLKHNTSLVTPATKQRLCAFLNAN